MYTYEDYLTTQLPVIWQPVAYQLTEITKPPGRDAAVHVAQHLPGELALRQVTTDRT